MLAAKTALAVRVDALGEDVGNDLGIEHRAKLEKRLRSLEDGGGVSLLCLNYVNCLLCSLSQDV